MTVDAIICFPPSVAISRRDVDLMTPLEPAGIWAPPSAIALSSSRRPIRNSEPADWNGGDEGFSIAGMGSESSLHPPDQIASVTRIIETEASEYAVSAMRGRRRMDNSVLNMRPSDC